MTAVPTQRIHKLPDTVINQIAAGEVIERPVSVVKELLENSLDAGASQITVEVRGGGSRLIRVTDDGCGIHPDDLQLAIDRHTTNKLFRAEDLPGIGTLGFRGEALSSIASVSRFTLTSRQAAAPHGWLVETGGTSAIKPAAHPAGTTVEVRDLFYNTPARRKFLRSEKSEFMHIHELVKRIALSRPGLSLRLVHNNREVVHLSGSDLADADRMRAVFGAQFAGHSVRVQQRSGAYTLSGWVGLPESARSQSDQQYFYLNGRSIRDKLINHAVRIAYADTLFPGRQPSYLLYLEMDAGAADVNVHPAKHEVRFRDPRDVHDFVFGCLASALTGHGQDVALEDVQHTAVHHPDMPHGRSLWNVRDAQEVAYARNYRKDTLAPKTGDHAKTLFLVQQRYILEDGPQGLSVIDIPRARELIALVRLRTAHAEGGIRSRPVLVPLIMPVTGQEEKLLEQHQSLLASLGLVVAHSAPQSVMVRELPLALAQADALALLKDVLARLRIEAGKMSNETLASDLVILLSQHVHDGLPGHLTDHEMHALLAELNSISTDLPDAILRSARRTLDRRDLQKLFASKS